jgi:hypothetical protein
MVGYIVGRRSEQMLIKKISSSRAIFSLALLVLRMCNNAQNTVKLIANFVSILAFETIFRPDMVDPSYLKGRPFLHNFDIFPTVNTQWIQGSLSLLRLKRQKQDCKCEKTPVNAPSVQQSTNTHAKLQFASFVHNIT